MVNPTYKHLDAKMRLGGLRLSQWLQLVVAVGLRRPLRDLPVAAAAGPDDHAQHFRRGAAGRSLVRRAGARVLRIGGEWEGWSEQRAADELDYIMRQIARDEWIPPQRDTPEPET